MASTWIAILTDWSSALVIVTCHLATDQPGNVEYEVIESLGG
ncbi:hypothetical protein [Ciceribacter sp. RN22]|nr:hypothetical protein [Ciceribacter sp. RN22]